MKALFLALLLINVLMFVGARYLGGETPAVNETFPATAAQAGALVLASEADGASRVSGSLAPAQQTAHCVSYGAFQDLQEAATTAASLKSKGFTPRTRAAQGEVWTGVWVYLKDLPSRAAADRTLESLKEHGIADAYIMPAGETTNEISLGLFSEPARAQRRAEEARRYGFSPIVVDRTRTGTVYWLDLDIGATDQPPEPESLQNASGRGQRLHREACPQGAVSR